MASEVTRAAPVEATLAPAEAVAAGTTHLDVQRLTARDL
jgi:hypothetical protein